MMIILLHMFSKVVIPKLSVKMKTEKGPKLESLIRISFALMELSMLLILSFKLYFKFVNKIIIHA